MSAILGDVEALVSEITRRARQRAVELETDAQREASRVMEEAAQESQAVRAQCERESAAELETIERRGKAQGELESRRHYTKLRETSLDRVWTAAEERLRRLTADPAYPEALKCLALDAARELAGKEVILAAGAEGHDLLTNDRLKEWSEEAQVEFRRAPEPASAWGGLVATQGRCRVNATFPVLLELAKTSLRERVFQALTRNEP